LRDLKTLGQGRYRIINLAGKGGMSQVFHAYDTLNDRDVAIKVLSLDLVSEEAFLARFQRESELMRDLDHPNILRAYDYGQEEDRVYLVMSYYGGGTLKDRLNQGPLALSQVGDYLTQIAAGLSYAHARNIVHRDVKPSNVLIHHAGDNLVLSDFGIAKALSNANSARTGTIMGTPLYMAPEQFLDKVDRRSDIYSLGIVLYQMLTGEVPFKGDGIGFKHLYDQMPPLKTWNLNYDPVIEQVVAQALAKRPEARFQSVDEMAQAFQAALADFARRDTRDAFKGFDNPVEKSSWSSIEKNPAVLPGQASLSELPVITPSQLKTEYPVNAYYLEQTAQMSLQDLQRFEFEKEPLPFHSLAQSLAEPVQPDLLKSEPELPAQTTRAYIPMQFGASAPRPQPLAAALTQPPPKGRLLRLRASARAGQPRPR
jgi:serine/threonine-protein kinase